MLLRSEDLSVNAPCKSECKKIVPVLHGALLESEQDIDLFEQPEFLNRHEGRQLVGSFRTMIAL
jgi:hypothetical protein